MYTSTKENSKYKEGGFISIIIKIFFLILYILLFLIVLLLLISILPFSYSLILEIYNSDMVGNASITWLNGFLGIQFFIEKEKYYTLSLFGKNLLTNTLEKEKKEKPEGVKSNKSKSKKLKKAKKRKNKSKLKSNKDKKDINLKELIPIFKKTLSKLFKKLKPDIFKLYGIYGFRNPALTGTLSGIISIMNGFKKIRIDLSPTFLEEIIHANINIKGQFRLIDLIIIFISTIIKAPIRKLISNSN